MDEPSRISDPPLEMQPQFHRGTLRFVQPELEAEYTRYFAHGSVTLVRLGLTLGLVLYLSFGLVDLAVAGEFYQRLWTIRAVGATVCLLGLGYSYLPGFADHLQSVMVVITCVLGGGILLMLLITGVPVINSYYVGLILVCIAAHTLLRLSFINSLWVCTAIVAGYLAVEFHLGTNAGHRIFTNFSFLGAAALIACIGSYVLAYQHRLAFYQNRIIQQARRESHYRSLHDDLTGLANRTLLAECAQNAIARSRRNHRRAALLFLDLDRFKALNDRWGHHVGDQVLKSVANMLMHTVREVDTVARLGGDEFVILLEGLDSDIEAQLLAKRIINQFDTSIQVPGGAIELQMSIGIAMYPEHGDSLEQLMHCADLAMYRAKQLDGSNWYLYQRANGGKENEPVQLKPVK